ncbi:MAG: glycosyltransferase [Bacteroidales bacterium]|nr:glycosyltransferase [Bacteroidales bacterium]
MSHQRKHILFLPRWYPNKHDNMWGLFVKKHAQAALLKNNISILYLEAMDHMDDDTEIIEEKSDGLYTLYIHYKKPKNSLLYLIKFIQLFIWGFREINKKNKINLIHVHILSRTGVLALLAKYVFNTPYIITEHWSRYLPSVNTFKGSIRIPLTKFIVKKASAVLPVTENLKSAMISHGLRNNHYKVVPNVVDDVFYATEIKTNTDFVKRIIHVSTFEDKSKNISGILKGIKKLSEIRNDFKMILIGDGMDFKNLKNLAEEFEIDHQQIEFTGLLEKEHLIKEYSAADFMLINSHYENMPVVINEAFACGLPVLSTDVGGISEHLNENRGRLMPPNNEKEFISNFTWMLDHCREFNPIAIREYAQDHFSYAGVGDVLDEVYDEACEVR